MRRLLLRDDVTRQQVQDLFESLRWQAVESESSLPGVIGFQCSWIDPRRTGVANYLENTVLRCAYIFASNSVVATLEEALRQRDLLLSAEEALNDDFATTDAAHNLKVIGRLGLLAHGTLDPRILAKLSALLVHPDDQWQRMTLYALTNTTWSEFEPVIRKCIEHGAFRPELAKSAAKLLSDLRQADWNASLYSE